MTHTPDQKARMATLEWALDLVRNQAGGAYRADLARAALSLAQWVSGDRDLDSPALGASPDFDADELPTIEIPGEVYVGGRRADGINPDEDADELPEFSSLEIQEMSAKGKAGAETGRLLRKLLGELSEDSEANTAFKEHYAQSFADFVSDGGDAGEALEFVLAFRRGGTEPECDHCDVNDDGTHN